MGAIFLLQLVLVGLALVVGLLWFAWKTLHFRPRHLVAFVEVIAGVIAGSLSRDRWGEVFDTIKRNKLRTVLTALSVAWGIFVMIVLLGLGNGLNNGARQSFRHDAMNAVWISANKTSIPYAGYNIGRKITFDNRDYEAAKKVPGIDHLTGRYYVSGGQFGGGEMKVQRGAKSNAFAIKAVHPDGIYIYSNDMTEGRFLNANDIAGRRKVAVIGKSVGDFLFAPPEGSPPGTPPTDPVGQWIEIGDVAFQVIGVFTDEGGEEEERQIYIPVSTAQLAFNGADHLGLLAFTVGNANAAKAKQIIDEVVAQLAKAHQFDPSDPQAVRVFNNVEGFEKFQSIFLSISIFVLVIGCGTLAAGVVGVSNIMMIAVKERTKEIGIRKALGATPLSIIAMIVQEAIFLTSIAGLLGLSAGIAALEVIPRLADSEMIRNPSVDIRVGVLAALGLIVAGAFAGFVPARAAARVNPVHTLRDQ